MRDDRVLSGIRLSHQVVIRHLEERAYSGLIVALS